LNDERPTHIDLFSGIGGFSLAAESVGWRTVVFCEKEAYCQGILRKHWPKVPIISDVREFDGRRHRGASLLSGGFPCQCFSSSGKQGGEKDDRYLWPEMLRVIKEARPRFVLAENVVGIINMALDTVLSDMESEGYTAGTVVLPACGLNALHKRSRVWIIADSNRERGCSRDLPREDAVDAGESSRCPNVGYWDIEPPVGRVAHGVSDKTHRIAALGNSIVPQVAREILKGLVKSYG